MRLSRLNVLDQAKALLGGLDEETRNNTKSQFFGGQRENILGDKPIQSLRKAARFNEVGIAPSRQSDKNLTNLIQTMPSTVRSEVEKGMEMPSFPAPKVGSFFKRLFDPKLVASKRWENKVPQAQAAAMPTAMPSPTAVPTAMPASTPMPTATMAPQATPTPKQAFDLTRFNLRPDIVNLLNMHAQEAGVPLQASAGILFNENGRFNPEAVNANSNGTADYGLWQLNNQKIFDPTENTKRSAALLNNKRTRLKQLLNSDDVPLGLLIEAYNKGADGAFFKTDPNYTYAKRALEKVGINPMDDPFLRNPDEYLRSRGL